MIVALNSFFCCFFFLLVVILQTFLVPAVTSSHVGIKASSFKHPSVFRNHLPRRRRGALGRERLGVEEHLGEDASPFKTMSRN